MMSLDENQTSPRTAATASATRTGWVPGEEGGERPPGENRWPELVAKVDASVASGEASAMLRAWQAASVAALLDREWQSMVAVGDAALRIGRATGLRFAFGAKARQAYQVALYRSHRAGAVDGVLSAADGFAELGDNETVEQCIAVAVRLLEKHPRPGAGERIDALRARLTRSR